MVYEDRDITPKRGAWMVDIVKRTAKAGSKPVATAKAPRTVAKPAKPAPEPIAKTPAPQPLAAAFVSPHTDIPAPIQAVAPTGIPASETLASETKDAIMDTSALPAQGR